MLNTDCSKCGTPVPPVPPPKTGGPFASARITVTGYRCQKCDHWNNLKRRKGWSEASAPKL